MMDEGRLWGLGWRGRPYNTGQMFPVQRRLRRSGALVFSPNIAAVFPGFLFAIFTLRRFLLRILLVMLFYTIVLLQVFKRPTI